MSEPTYFRLVAIDNQQSPAPLEVYGTRYLVVDGEFAFEPPNAFALDGWASWRFVGVREGARGSGAPLTVLAARFECRRLDPSRTEILVDGPMARHSYSAERVGDVLLLEEIDRSTTAGGIATASPVHWWRFVAVPGHLGSVAQAG